MRLSCDSEARTSQSQKCSRDAIWATRGPRPVPVQIAFAIVQIAVEISLACETR